MRLLIDLNLSPEWVGVLAEAGFHAVHWSVIGSAGAPDQEILAWAGLHGHVILTHDLDFGAILAATQAKFPSVLQVRSQDVNPHHLKDVVISALDYFAEWSAVAQWNPSARYQAIGTATETDGRLMLSGTKVLLRRI